MLTQTATRTHAVRRTPSLGNRFVFWLLALDAGHRNARALSRATDGQLADMGLTRFGAEAEVARFGASDETPARSFGAW